MVYLESIFSRDGKYEMDVERRIATGNRVNRTLAALMRRRNSTAVRLAVHNAMYSLQHNAADDTDAVIQQRNVGITEKE